MVDKRIKRGKTWQNNGNERRGRETYGHEQLACRYRVPLTPELDQTLAKINMDQASATVTIFSRHISFVKITKASLRGAARRFHQRRLAASGVIARNATPSSAITHSDDSCWRAGARASRRRIKTISAASYRRAAGAATSGIAKHREEKMAATP